MLSDTLVSIRTGDHTADSIYLATEMNEVCFVTAGVLVHAVFYKLLLTEQLWYLCDDKRSG